MIKTIQYLAEADTSRVLVALELRAAFEMCPEEPCFTVLSKTVRT